MQTLRSLLFSLFLLSALLSACLTPPAALAQGPMAELKVLSLNTWGLPFPVGQDLDERLPRIAKAVQGHDIVLLQETFDGRFDHFPKLADYPHWVHHNTSNLWDLRSGLLTLSKYPIIKSEFRRFNKCAYPDCLAHKGILFTRIQHPTLGPVDVYNTHFQSRPHEDARQVRIEAGNTLMRDFILSNHQYYPTILGGDFNEVYGDLDYQDLLKRLHLIDTLSVASQQKPAGTIAPYRQQGRRESKHCIDYIFVLKNALYDIQVKSAKVLFQEHFENYYLSDHFGVVSQIVFQKP